MYGISPSAITYNLEVLSLPEYEDGIENKEEKLLAVCTDSDWFKDNFYKSEDFNWKDHGSSFPGKELAKAFTLDEQCRIWFAQFVMSSLHEFIEKEHPILEKVRMTMHHCFSRNYLTFSKIVNGLSKLTWPGGEVKLVWTTKYRCDGPAAHEIYKDNLWLDNDFGALIYVGGKHVLTIAFGGGPEGIYLSQVQLKNKKGNRFLYKLSNHYLDLAIEMLANAFEMPIWLIKGNSAVNCIRASYGKSVCSMTFDDELRIANLYDKELSNYVRTNETKRNFDRREHVLLRSK